MSSSPTPQASSSPTPTATANIADLLASFTSTSSDSTAVRIARERRKQEREARWESRKTELEGVEGEGPASEDGLRRGGGFQSPPRPWPKLHVQESESIGGRSYSPSLPGSPLPGTPGGAVLSPPPTADLPAPKPSPSPTTPSPTRKPAAIAEIPPFRPKPTPSPTSKPISSPGTGGAGEDKVKVTMSMGLMERLKAKKAAAGAGAGGDASARTGGAPSQQVAAAVPLPDTPTQASRTSPPRQSQPPLVPSPVATPPRQSLLPTSPPHISPSHPSPPVSTTPLDDSPPRTSLPRTEPTQHPSLPNYPLSSPSYQFTASSTAPATSPAKPSAKERVEEQLARLERSDDDEEVPGVTRWDIQGNEFSFEPTPLSPLTERSERATISTRRDSLRSQRSLPPVWNGYSDDPISAPPSSAGGRQLADGTYRPAALAKPLPPSSIFDVDSRSSPRISSSSSPAQERSRNPSPTRRMSPELQRRAALFDTQEDRMGMPDFGAERERRRLERGVHRKAASEVGSGEVSRVSTPRTPALETLWEGYLLCPPANSQSQAESLARWKEWDRRWSVLTPETLEFRPSNSASIVALILADCVDMRSKFEEQNSQFRPIAVVLNDGGEELFAALNSTEKIDWMMAIGGAIDVANPNATKRWMRKGPEIDLPLPPSPKKASRSPTFPKKVEADQRSISSGSSLAYADSVLDLPMPSRAFPLRSPSTHSDSTRPPLQSVDDVKEKDPAFFNPRPASLFSQGSSLFGAGARSRYIPPNSSPLNEEHRDLFAYYSTKRAPTASPKPLSINSTSSLRGVLPTLPHATTSFRSPTKPHLDHAPYSPSLGANFEPYRSDSPRSSGHRRAQSEAVLARMREGTRSLRDIDLQTQTTRGGAFSPAEYEEWKRDLNRMAAEASGFSETSSQAIVRERREAERLLEGRDRSAPPIRTQSPCDLPPLPSSPSKSLRSNPNIVRPIPTSPYRQHVDKCFETRSSGLVAPNTTSVSGTVRVEPFSRWSNDTTEAEARRRSQQASTVQGFPQPTNDFGDPGDVFSAATPRARKAPSNDSRQESQEGSPRTANTGASRTPRQLTEMLAMIHGQLQQQSSQGEQNWQHQQQVSKFITELSSFMSEESQRRDAKQQELAEAVRSIQQHVASLPDALLARLNAADEHLASEIQPTTVDTDFDPPTANDPVDAQMTRTVSSSRGIIKPEPFVELERKMSGVEPKEKGKKASLSRKVKGPRAPMTIAGQRLWGAPDPLGDRRVRWGAGAATVAKEAETKQINAIFSKALEDAKKPAPNQALADAIIKDEELGRILSDVAQGDPTDAGTMALAIYEILRTTRELSKQQEAQAAKEKEQGVRTGLSKSEKAELDAKKQEIQRLELMTQSSSAHAAQIDKLIAKLNAKGEKTDELLKSISNAVSSPKTMQMDPSLTEATKKLLGSVKQGVDTHVKEFRGQLTSEVQKMVKEVGRLRDEKKELQATIADLLAFQAKQGSMPSRSAAPISAPATRVQASPAKPKAGMPTSGFFGPRPMQ